MVGCFWVRPGAVTQHQTCTLESMRYAREMNILFTHNIKSCLIHVPIYVWPHLGFLFIEIRPVGLSTPILKALTVQPKALCWKRILWRCIRWLAAWDIVFSSCELTFSVSARTPIRFRAEVRKCELAARDYDFQSCYRISKLLICVNILVWIHISLTSCHRVFIGYTSDFFGRTVPDPYSDSTATETSNRRQHGYVQTISDEN